MNLEKYPGSLYGKFVSFLLVLSLCVSTSTVMFTEYVFANDEGVVMTEHLVTVDNPVSDQVATVESNENTDISQIINEPTDVVLDPAYSSSDIQPTSNSDLLESTINPADIINEDSSEDTTENEPKSDISSTGSIQPEVTSSSTELKTIQYQSTEYFEATSTSDLKTDSEKLEIKKMSEDIETQNYTEYVSIDHKRVKTKIKRAGLTPSKEFKISLTGRRVATRVNSNNESYSVYSGENLKKGKNVKINRKNLHTISEADIKIVNSSPNIKTGEVIVEKISVSGACSQKYYVILLYKNISDYENNPSSYILNKAFECTDGSYRYNIDSLPKNFEKGTYYLLVGQQDDGPWTPLSSLNEITIN